MDKSKISWTHATWNFVVCCSKVSPGCENCYAERLALRYGWSKKPWTAPNARANVVIKQDKLKLPFKWKEPRKIFVNSLSDLFHPLVSIETIAAAFGVMAATPQHTYQILTKRPLRMNHLFVDSRFVEMCKHEARKYTDAQFNFPLKNVWLGVSVEDQRRADERIPLLLQTPASVRFLSCEPLLGEIDLSPYLEVQWYAGDMIEPRRGTIYGKPMPAARLRPRVDWVIVGGESGPHYRAMDLDWARSLRDQCVSANVPFFYKQGSAFRSEQDTLLDGVEWHQFPDEKGSENYVAADAQSA